MRTYGIIVALSLLVLFVASSQPLTFGQVKDESLVTILEGKTTAEKADIKSTEIVKYDYSAGVTSAKYDIVVEIQSVEKINGGVQVIARAWKGGDQLGFGKDGTVEWERFRIYNPPVLVPDPLGKIVQTWTTLDPDTLQPIQHSRTLREDPAEALRLEIAHTVSLVGKLNTAIVPGSIGNTTDTFYPDAGDPGTTSIDGNVGDESSITPDWDTIHDATSLTAIVTAASGRIASVGRAGNGNLRMHRGFFNFDTSSLPDTDTIDSATVSFYGTTDFFNGDDDGDDWVNVFQNTIATDNTLVDGDFDQCSTVNSPTEGSTRIDLGSWNQSDYNDFALDATGLTWVSKTSITKLCTREGHDAIDSPIAGGTINNIASSYLADQTGTTNDPKLVIVHSAGVTDFTLKVNRGSIKVNAGRLYVAN